MNRSYGKRKKKKRQHVHMIGRHHLEIPLSLVDSIRIRLTSRPRLLCCYCFIRLDFFLNYFCLFIIFLLSFFLLSRLLIAGSISTKPKSMQVWVSQSYQLRSIEIEKTGKWTNHASVGELLFAHNRVGRRSAHFTLHIGAGTDPHSVTVVPNVLLITLTGWQSAGEHGCSHRSARHPWWWHTVHECSRVVISCRVRVGATAVHSGRRLGWKLHFQRFTTFRHSLHLALQQSVVVMVLMVVVGHALFLLEVRHAIVVRVGRRNRHVGSV